MNTGQPFLARAPRWLSASAYGFRRSLALILGLGLVWWLKVAVASDNALVWFALVWYGLAHLVLIVQDRYRRSQRTHSARWISDWLYLPLDGVFALLLWSQVKSFAIIPLYFLIALRTLATCQRQPFVIVTPFLLGILYLAPIYRDDMLVQVASDLASFMYPRFSYPADTLVQVARDTVLLRWVLLLGSVSFGTAAIWSSTIQRRVSENLRQELSIERSNRESRVGELERIAQDLRSRMRELHALEEGLRVITSTLSLDEVLNQIVDSTIQMMGTTRVHGLVLSLLSEDGFEHHSFMQMSTSGHLWAEQLSRRVIRQEVPVIIGNVEVDDPANVAVAQGLCSALCVPLIVGERGARGALTVISSVRSAFSSSDARHLTAFAIQAGIALHNAELHSRLRRQQQLLAAVVRDINDGLVVVDAHLRIVLTNPIGRDLLDCRIATTSVREHLLMMVAGMRAENTPMLMSDLCLTVDGQETERVFQALASRSYQGDVEEPLIAIVLHDITAQKAEERLRTEFISMVSHELRNPLHSLNGFIKVLLQGRAGTLTSLQREFLEIADSQIEQLKGRIAELLEFNRLEAGRLVLNPEWNHLPALIGSTITRLRLQAEQAGLTLRNEIADQVPECYCDSERIGQVLTNLIENAMKATPAGGVITVRSEVHESEIWLQVIDTGVGIPLEEQHKVFQRFYRLHHHASTQGNHLGLGLAICQQIVEGHQGRIWVESEEGRGSVFSFALPLFQREHGELVGVAR